MSRSHKARGEALFLISESEGTSESLRRHSPVLHALIVLCLTLAMLLPIALYGAYLLLNGARTLRRGAILPGVLGAVFALLSGVGTANLCMLPIQRICDKALRRQHTVGLLSPLYLGHHITLLFLLGCGGLSALCGFITLQLR